MSEGPPHADCHLSQKITSTPSVKIWLITAGTPFKLKQIKELIKAYLWDILKESLDEVQ